MGRLLGVSITEMDELASQAPTGSLVLHLGTAPQDFSDLPLVRPGGGTWPLPLDVSGVEPAWFARAAIESAAYAASEAIAWLDDAAPGSGPVRICGGMTRSHLWVRSLASVLKEPVEVWAEDATSIGATGASAPAPEAVVEPDEDMVGPLGGAFSRWLELVGQLDAGALRISDVTGGSQ
jgi:sugar (pentulose or hexulose) kinase